MKIKKLILAAGAFLSVSAASGAVAAAPAEQTDSLSLAVGSAFGHDLSIQLQRLRSLGITVDMDIFVRSLDAALRGEPSAMSADAANAWLDNYIAATRPDDLPDVFSAQSQQDFLDSVASLPGAVRYPDGLVMFVETEGEGAMPTDGDIVRLLYAGRLYNGQEFDATASPIEFGVSEVTPGFSEGLKLMRPGGRYRIVMPASLAYGPEGIPGAIPGNAALDFTVELLGVRPASN